MAMHARTEVSTPWWAPLPSNSGTLGVAASMSARWAPAELPWTAIRVGSTPREAALARIAATQPKVNAFTTLLAERALGEAALVDAAVAAGKDPGQLAGVPYAVKDLIDIADISTLAGSRINRAHPPAARVATARHAGRLAHGAPHSRSTISRANTRNR